MKKYVALMLAVLMVFALAACGETPAQTEQTPEQTTEQTPENTEKTPENTEGGEPTAPVVLADEGHAAWVAHGQYLLADGTPNSWNGKDSSLYEASALTPIALEDADPAIQAALAGKEVKYLYTIDLIFGTNDAGWTARFLKDGKLFKANGSYAVKIAQCSVDKDGDNVVYAEEQWISDPKTAYVESLTPDTIFYPTWQEEPDENGFSWADNPVVTGGPGLYTLVIAQYKTVSAAGNPGFGVGLILKEAKEGIEYEEILEWIPGDHTYGIIGGFNGWAEDVAMEAGENDTWTGEVELTAGEQFKVRADGVWDNSWGDPSTESGNCVVAEDGTYVVTITFADGAGTVTAEKK
ncbi:MAG: glycogen-binding domain-containing protein [Oscillospiraceae bacterium]|nr:glycogen-binding domain-containing protein [Oscillospiraceae bacterium]